MDINGRKMATVAYRLPRNDSRGMNLMRLLWDIFGYNSSKDTAMPSQLHFRNFCRRHRWLKPALLIV